MYFVDLCTSQDRLSGRVKHGTKPGPKPYLTNKEEVKCLVETYISKECDLKQSATDGGKGF